MYLIVLVLLVIVSVCLVGVVLLQSGKGNNLTTGFQGEATFGNRSGDVLTKSTMVLAISFLVLCLAATLLYKQSSSSLFSRTIGAQSSRTENLKSMAQQEADAKAAQAEAKAAAQAAEAEAEAVKAEAEALETITTNLVVEGETAIDGAGQVESK